MFYYTIRIKINKIDLIKKYNINPIEDLKDNITLKLKSGVIVSVDENELSFIFAEKNEKDITDILHNSLEYYNDEYGIIKDYYVLYKEKIEYFETEKIDFLIYKAADLYMKDHSLKKDRDVVLDLIYNKLEIWKRPKLINKKHVFWDKDVKYALINKVDNLIGVEEFKNLCHNLVNTAKISFDAETYELFSRQAFLFSIDDGYGLTKYLYVLRDLYSELRFNVNSFVREFKIITPNMDDSFSFNTETIFSELVKMIDNLELNERYLVSLDISDLLNIANTSEFSSFLLKLEKFQLKFIFVFRVPYIDKDLLENVRRRVADIFCLKTVSFPPFTMDELLQYGENKAKEYGYKLDENSKNNLSERIISDKNRNAFYGMHSVKNLVNKMVLLKQEANSKNESSDKTIRNNISSKLLYENNKFRELSAKDLLNSLVGAEYFEKIIYQIVAQIKYSKEHPSVNIPCIHMKFVGNPGTGKTTVARIVGKLLKEEGILSKGYFFEMPARDLCGEYIGHTAPKTLSICRDAYGSVLFLDEAYSLYKGAKDSKDYGKEAIDTLISEMENHRNDMVIIMAGYKDEMDDLMKINPGLSSRIPFEIVFPNFTREQLYKVFKSMLDGQFEYDEDLLVSVKEYFNNLPNETINSKEFSNARFVRNLFERTWGKTLLRCQLNNLKDIKIIKDDFINATNDSEFNFNIKKTIKTKLGFNM